jgi:hypothetical protein
MELSGRLEALDLGTITGETPIWGRGAFLTDMIPFMR